MSLLAPSTCSPVRSTRCRRVPRAIHLQLHRLPRRRFRPNPNLLNSRTRHRRHRLLRDSPFAQRPQLRLTHRHRHHRGSENSRQLRRDSPFGREPRHRHRRGSENSRQLRRRQKLTLSLRLHHLRLQKVGLDLRPPRRVVHLSRITRVLRSAPSTGSSGKNLDDRDRGRLSRSRLRLRPFHRTPPTSPARLPKAIPPPPMSWPPLTYPNRSSTYRRSSTKRRRPLRRSRSILNLKLKLNQSPNRQLRSRSTPRWTN
jgi:hypothetical protein